jgi:hypothetical protein
MRFMVPEIQWKESFSIENFYIFTKMPAFDLFFENF